MEEKRYKGKCFCYSFCNCKNIRGKEIKDGIVKNCYESGKLKSKALFKNNIPNGIEKKYNEDGTLESKAIWERRQKDKIKRKY